MLRDAVAELFFGGKTASAAMSWGRWGGGERAAAAAYGKGAAAILIYYANI